MELKKAIIIDDEEDFCFFIKKNLEKATGLQVSICSNSEEALKQIDELKPDLILLDILMPKISGLKIAEELKNKKETQGIPIIFLTAAVKPEEIKDWGYCIQGKSVFTKPIRINEIVSKIRQISQQNIE